MDRIAVWSVALLGLALGASPARAAPVVQTMVVGARGQIVSAPRQLVASAATVAVGSRRCALAAATPLAALADLRALGGPAFSVRDYGHCGSSARNSAALFVYAMAGETNVGRDGWEYKVNGRAGSTGAGDTSGPFGDGRPLGAGQQLLWFWCHSAAGGCQRSLSVTAAAAVYASHRLAVRVLGYDNEGRAVPIAGATVRLGRSSAVTNGAGRASVPAPGRRGRYQLGASRRGLVPSFPETIVVR